jgi:hypothetical protein
MPQPSVVLVAVVGVGQQLLLGHRQQRQGWREQRAIERLDTRAAMRRHAACRSEHPPWRVVA